MTTAVLQYRVNGGAVTTGVTTVVAEDEIQLIAASYAGWGSPASLWEITAYPPGFPCPSGWSTNATTGRYYYLSNNTSLIPPVITMPASAAIASGQWGKFLFALTVLGGGAGLVDTSCGVKIASSAGAEDIAIGEEAQFDEKLRYVEAHQTNARLLDQAAASGGSGGVLLGSGTPVKVTAVGGSAGALATAAPFDHAHEVGVGSPVNIGTANSDGVSDNLARADHVHALPWATVTSVFGGATTALPMNGQKITGLGTPSSNGDAATKLYVDGIVTFARVAAALATASSALDFNGQVLGDVDTPVDPTDAANKAYVDGVLGNAVPIARTIATTAPLTGGGDLSGDLTLAISAASGSAAGSMSSAHYALIAAATDAPTANTLALRGTGGRAAFGWIAPALTGVATAGFIRVSSTAQSVISADSVGTPGTNFPIVSIDGADGVLIGSDAAIWVRAQAVTGFGVQNNAGDDLFTVEPGANRILVGNGNIDDLTVDVTDVFASSAKRYAFTTLTASTGVAPTNNTWVGQSAFSGNNLPGGGFTFTVGNGGNATNTGGNFTIHLGTENGGGISASHVWQATTAGTFLSLCTAGGVAKFTAPDEARWAVGAGGFTVHNEAGESEHLIVDPINALLGLTLIDTIEFGAGKTSAPLSPVITQAKLTGTDGDDAQEFLIEGAQGQDAEGAADNSSGGHIRIRGGAPGTGGSGSAGHRGNIFLGAGTASAGNGKNVVVVNDSTGTPGTPSSGFVFYGLSGAFRVVQHAPPTVTGARNDNPALASLLTTLETMGLIIDSTTV